MFAAKEFLNFLFLIILSLFISSAVCFKRTFKSSVNENCTELCKEKRVILFYVKAMGPNDTIHHLFDFTYKPTMLMAVTDPTVVLSINWTKYLSDDPVKSIKFSQKPIYTYGFVVEKIFEFNDYWDNARIDTVGDRNITELKMNYFKWKYKNFTQIENSIQIDVLADSYANEKNNDYRNGSINFSLHVFGSTSYYYSPPNIRHSENSTQLDIVINNLDTCKNYSSSRFAYELSIISETDPNIDLTLDTKSTIDDEYSPGIFNIIKLGIPNNTNAAYIEWKPVSYLNKKREAAASTEVVSYNKVKVKNFTDFDRGTFLSIYDTNELLSFLVQKMNISVGEKNDKFYRHTKYSTLTLIIGNGSTPGDWFSMDVIMFLITMGIVLPLIIIVGAGTYLYRRRDRNQYELFDD